MKRLLFAAAVLFVSSPLFAQTSAAGARPATTAPGAAAQTITMTGCVGGQGSDAQPYMLNNPFVVPSTGATAPGAVGSTSATGAQPPTGDPTGSSASSPSLPPAATPTPPSA